MGLVLLAPLSITPRSSIAGSFKSFDRQLEMDEPILETGYCLNNLLMKTKAVPSVKGLYNSVQHNCFEHVILCTTVILHLGHPTHSKISCVCIYVCTFSFVFEAIKVLLIFSFWMVAIIPSYFLKAPMLYF